jgi:nucleoside diphosphate kinase
VEYDASIETLRETDRWMALTAVPQKFQLFSRESYFREGWDVAQEVFGLNALAELQKIAVLTLKPEAVAGRRIEHCLDYMAQHGFKPIATRAITYNRFNTREIWRYQWNVATLDRLEVSDLTTQLTKSLIVVFRDERPDVRIPATVRLAGLKGSSLPWERHKEHLRSVLGALNRMIVMVHCSDEPIDILREFGIIFTRSELRELFVELDSVLRLGTSCNISERKQALYSATNAEHVSIESAFENLRLKARNNMASSGVEGRAASKRILGILESIREDEYMSWKQWSCDLHESGLGVNSWDQILIASHFIRHDVPGASCVIGESGRERWLEGHGLSLCN